MNEWNSALLCSRVHESEVSLSASVAPTLFNPSVIFYLVLTVALNCFAEFYSFLFFIFQPDINAHARKQVSIYVRRVEFVIDFVSCKTIKLPHLDV